MASKLLEMQSRFHQRQLQEREEKLLRLYQSQQEKAIKIARGSAGSTSSISSTGSMGGGKVRQMFDERRKEGVDRSYPLQPLNKNKRTTVTKTTYSKTAKTSLQNGVSYRHVNNNIEVSRDDYANSNVVELVGRLDLSDGILDDEEMPELDEGLIDNQIVVGKLANLGGQLPSEVYAKEKEKKKETAVDVREEKRKAQQPIVKKTVIRKVSNNLTAKGDSQNPSASNSATSQPILPTKTDNSKSSVVMKGTTVNRQTAAAQRRQESEPAPGPRLPPGTSRPSARQSPKAAVVRDDLEQCKYCNRRFAADRLLVHEEICAKTIKKRRKTYDATKHRVQGTELEPYVKRGPKGTSSKREPQMKFGQPTGKTGDWRRKHEEFIAAIRAAKDAQAHVARGGKISDLPPPPPSSNPDYVQCPHCGRRFNEAAAARHIPKCATYEFNKPKGGPTNRGRNGR